MGACYIMRKQDTSPSTVVSAESLQGNEGSRVDQDKKEKENKNKSKNGNNNNNNNKGKDGECTPEPTKAQANSELKAAQVLPASAAASVAAVSGNRKAFPSNKSTASAAAMSGNSKPFLSNKSAAFPASVGTAGSQPNAFAQGFKGQAQSLDKIQGFDLGAMQANNMVPKHQIGQAAAPVNIFAGPTGPAMSKNVNVHQSKGAQAMLPANQALPTELFTITTTKTSVFSTNYATDDPYAAKDTLKLWERLKVKYGEFLLINSDTFRVSRLLERKTNSFGFPHLDRLDCGRCKARLRRLRLGAPVHVPRLEQVRGQAADQERDDEPENSRRVQQRGQDHVLSEPSVYGALVRVDRKSPGDGHGVGALRSEAVLHGHRQG